MQIGDSISIDGNVIASGKLGGGDTGLAGRGRGPPGKRRADPCQPAPFDGFGLGPALFLHRFIIIA